MYPKELILVEKGIKPILMFFSKKVPVSTGNYLIYSYPWFDGEKRVVAFNLSTLEKILEIFKEQKSFEITSTKDLLNLFDQRYKSLDPLPWSKQQRLDFIFIEGISLGYPLDSVKLFIQELETKKHRSDRISYETSDLIAFIGYPETSAECEALNQLWKNQLKNN